MTVRVRVVLGTMGPSWEHDFWERHDFLYSSRDCPQGKWQTLQGSYPLILDKDENCTLVSMELLLSSAYWQVQDDLRVPLAESGQVFVQEDINDARSQAFLTNPGYTVLYTRLGAEEGERAVQHVAIAEQVVLDIDQSGTLAGVWLLDLPPEIAAARLGSSTDASAGSGCEGDID